MSAAVWGAGSTAVAAAIGAYSYGMLAPNSTLFGPVIGRGPRDGHALYLTFDDGPSPSATERILSTLEARSVPAAFFLLGRHVRMHPRLAARVGHTGHEIGNHTQRHAKLHLKGRRFIEAELRAAHASIQDVAGRSPRAFRAPHGYRNPAVQSIARELRYEIFGWTLGVWDSDRPGAEEIRRRVRRGLKPGDSIPVNDGERCDGKGYRTQSTARREG